MVFPVIYAVTTWYLAALWRRRWCGLLTVACSFSILLLLFTSTRHIRDVDGVPSPMLSFHVLLIPYTALVGVVGTFIWLMPRPPLPDYHCRGCHYDLRGLDPTSPICPECGKPIPPAPPPEYRIPIPRKPPPGGPKPTL